MHKIKEMLMKELYEYEEKAKKMNGGKLSAGDLETLHKLTDTVKNIDKIEMLEEDGGYSEDGAYMGEGRIYGTSYARGRRNARRDSMGRYSREGGMPYDGSSSYARGGMRDGRMGYSRDGAKEHMIEKMEDMMEEAETPREKEAIRQCIMKLEQA
jgi:hypothetical protein